MLQDNFFGVSLDDGKPDATKIRIIMFEKRGYLHNGQLMLLEESHHAFLLFSPSGGGTQ